MSVALSTIPTAAGPGKKRGPYRLTDADRENRSKHIRQFAGMGGRAAAAKSTPEERKERMRLARAGLTRKMQIMKTLDVPESVENLKTRRKRHEASREKILDTLVKMAKEPDAEHPIMSAALRELRVEEDRLYAKEKEAIAARAAGLTPKSPTANPSESPSDPDKPSVLASD